MKTLKVSLITFLDYIKTKQAFKEAESGKTTGPMTSSKAKEYLKQISKK